MVPEQSTDSIQLRLRRIEGQIRGIIGMLSEGKPCEQVVTQILAARAAMDRVAMEVLRCEVEDALAEKPPDQAREAILRAMDLINRVQ